MGGFSQLGNVMRERWRAPWFGPGAVLTCAARESAAKRGVSLHLAVEVGEHVYVRRVFVTVEEMVQGHSNPRTIVDRLEAETKALAGVWLCHLL